MNKYDFDAPNLLLKAYPPSECYLPQRCLLFWRDFVARMLWNVPLVLSGYY